LTLQTLVKFLWGHSKVAVMMTCMQFNRAATAVWSRLLVCYTQNAAKVCVCLHHLSFLASRYPVWAPGSVMNPDSSVDFGTILYKVCACVFVCLLTLFPYCLLSLYFLTYLFTSLLIYFHTCLSTSSRMSLK